jgi:zinc protease
MMLNASRLPGHPFPLSCPVGVFHRARQRRPPFSPHAKEQAVQLVDQFQWYGTFPVKHYRWDNGLQVFLVHNPISSVVAYLTHYTVGSASEREDQRGLAHFFEHMMFRETELLRDGDFDRIIAECGGVGLNASTSYDTTAYYVNVPAAQLERLVRLEADRMVNLKLSPELIEKERGAVLGEINMYKDMPSDQFWNAAMAAAFREHPYRHPIIGYPEQVAAFKTEDFAAFYRDHYAPNRAVIVVAGGFEEETVLKLLDQHYGALLPGAPRPAPAPAEPPPTSERRVELTHGKISTEYLLLGTHTPGIAHPHQPAIVLLSAVLGAGRSSPLHRRIVLEGLGTGVSCSVMDAEWKLVSPGLFLITVDLRHGVAAEAAEQAVDALLRDARRDGFGAEEIARAKNQIRLNGYSALQTNMGLARQLAGYQVACGDPRFGEKLLAAVARVTPEQLQDALERYALAPGRLTVVQRPEAA